MGFRRVRRVGLALLLAALPAAADTIVLKNGRRIEAWGIEERGDRVYYETRAGQVSLSKSLIERIERGGGLPDWGASELPEATNLPEASLPALGDADVLRVVEGGKIDRGLLAQLEREAAASNTEAARMRAAAAQALVARQLAGQGNAAEAADSLRRALRFAPNHPALLLNLAAVEVQQQRFGSALETLRPVLADKEYAFEAYRLQGWIYYQMEEMDRAIAAWKQALAVRADSGLEARLAQIEREARAAEEFEQRASGRFLLRYPEQEVATPRLASAILRALDAMYDQMAGAFNLAPREPIVVLLYPNETFYDLTGMPFQVHGLYDGKIRVPVQGLVELTPPLEQVLRHELVHAFVFLKSRGRARRWLQEGLAQYYAGQRPQVAPQAFQPLFAPRDGSALARIEAAFAGDAGEVLGAYAASWLVADTLMRRYGRGDMERMLEALAEGESTEQALRRAFRLTLADLDREVFDALR